MGASTARQLALLPILAAIALLPVCNACSSGGSGHAAPDSGTDSDADADTDADTDTDTDTTTDTDTNEYWTWSESSISYSLCNAYHVLRLWAVAEDDAVICGGTEGGFLAEFDGSSVTASSLPVGFDDFVCRGVWGSGDDVWAWGNIDYTSLEPEYSVLRRSGDSWVEEPVEGFEACATVTTSCQIQAMYTDASSLPHATGWTENWSSIDGERIVWAREEASGEWIQDTDAVFPGFDLLHELSGFLHWPGCPLAIVSGPITYWGGYADDGSSVLAAGSALEDLGFPLEEEITWLGRRGEDELVASTGLDLQLWDGSAWGVVASTTECDPSESCWNGGAVDGDDNVYLAGGHASGGKDGPDQWRLHRWDGEALTEILEPCPEPDPYCGLHDVGVAGTRVFAVGKRENNCLLLWADIP